MFMLRCAANNYRLAMESAREGCSPELINRLLADARWYDEQARG